MTIAELITEFRSRADDEQNIGMRFTPLSVAKFLTSGIRYMNDNVPCATRFQYLTLTPKKDSYELPSDFIHSEYVFDMRYQDQLRRTNEADTLRKQIGNVYAYCAVDQTNRGRLLFLDVPGTWLGVDFETVAFASDELSYYSFSIYAGQCYFDPTIIKVTDSSANVEYLRATITETTNEYKEMTQTVTVPSPAANTLEASASVALFLQEGDTIRINSDQVLTISSVDGTEIVVNETITVASGAGYSLEKYVTVYSSFISERDITGAGEITLGADQTLNLPDIMHCYIVYPPNYYEIGAGTVSTVGTAVTGVGTSFTTQFAVGDIIQVAGRMWSEVSAIASDTAMTLSTALDSDVTGVSYHSVRASYTPPIPLDYHNYIPDFAKLMAYQNEIGNETLAADQLEVCEVFLNKIKSEKTAEMARAANQNMPVNPLAQGDYSWRSTNPNVRRGARRGY